MGAGASGVAKMEHLAKTQFFGCMDKADLKILSKQAKLKFYATGQQASTRTRTHTEKRGK